MVNVRFAEIFSRNLQQKFRPQLPQVVNVRFASVDAWLVSRGMFIQQRKFCLEPYHVQQTTQDLFSRIPSVRPFVCPVSPVCPSVRLFIHFHPISTHQIYTTWKRVPLPVFPKILYKIHDTKTRLRTTFPASLRARCRHPRGSRATWAGSPNDNSWARCLAACFFFSRRTRAARH